MATKQEQAYIDAAAPIFASAGVRDFEIDRSRRHPSIAFAIRGSSFTFPFPKTPGDHRSFKNWCSQLKHKIADSHEMANKRAK